MLFINKTNFKIKLENAEKSNYETDTVPERFSVKNFNRITVKRAETKLMLAE